MVEQSRTLLALISYIYILEKLFAIKLIVDLYFQSMKWCQYSNMLKFQKFHDEMRFGLTGIFFLRGGDITVYTHLP